MKKTSLIIAVLTLSALNSLAQSSTVFVIRKTEGVVVQASKVFISVKGQEVCALKGKSYAKFEIQPDSNQEITISFGKVKTVVPINAQAGNKYFVFYSPELSEAFELTSTSGENAIKGMKESNCADLLSKK